MRKAFFDELKTIFETRRDAILLTGDLGWNVFEGFKDCYKDSFYDVGVAEADMIGIASGLAHCGKKPYCYSIIPFLTMRAFEQIRMDVAYHNLDVRLIGFGSGFTYGLEGFSHFGLEDIALMRSLPNMTVVSPSDKAMAKALARVSYDHKGPLYVRLGKTEGIEVHTPDIDFKIGKAITICEGRDVALIATGSMVSTAVLVADMLNKDGMSATVIDIHTIKPFDAEAVLGAANNHPAIFSMEEHYTEGGLGSAVAEILAENAYAGLFRRIGVKKLEQISGSAEHLKERYGLSRGKIYDTIKKELKR